MKDQNYHRSQTVSTRNNRNLWLPIVAIGGIMSLNASAQKRQPNVIVILADDLGYGDLSCYGATKISTPNIDKLANNGIRFTQGYATSATSTPSRYALMTGMYPWKNPSAKILPGDAPLIISTTQSTLPKKMKEAGYTTAAIGKWHLGLGNGTINWNEKIFPSPNDIGFDYSNVIAATNDRVPTVYVENGKVIGLEKDDPIEVSYSNNFPDEPTALTHPHLLKMKWSDGHNNSIVNGIPRIGYMKGGTNARWVDENMAQYFVDRTKEFVNKNALRPFFLYYGLHQPHVPRAPASQFVGKSGMGPRGDAILEADWCVGQLIAHLTEKKLLENTIIIFSSDNGPVLDDGYADQAVELLGSHTPSGVLRGGKYSLYEAGTRVPFIVSWNGKVKSTVSEAIVCQIDLMASLQKMAKAPQTKEKLDSQDMLNALLGKSPKGRTELIIEAQGRLAYRKGDYILIPPYKGAKTNVTGNELGNVRAWSLFNVKTDIRQEKNIAESEPKVLAEMKSDFLRATNGYSNPKLNRLQ